MLYKNASRKIRVVVNYIIHSGELKILSVTSKQWDVQQSQSKHTIIIQVTLFQTYSTSKLLYGFQ